MVLRAWKRAFVVLRALWLLVVGALLVVVLLLVKQLQLVLPVVMVEAFFVVRQC
jgi:hypothetical protein